VDRLIALLSLRLRLHLRELLGRREHAFGLALLLPWLLLSTVGFSALVFFGVRALARTHPELVLPALSAAATLLGLFWALAPLLGGLALAETHDLTRLLLFPVPFRTLLASSMLSNLVEPTVLAKLPPLLALAAALAGHLAQVPLVVLGALAAFAFTLTTAETVGLALQALSRNRRFHDRALFLGVGLGFLLSLVPLLVMAGGRTFGQAARAVLAADLFAVSPYAWGVRAAVHAGRGEMTAFLVWMLAAALAVLGAFSLNAVVARRLYEGELVLSGSSRGTSSLRRRLVLPGLIGALVEKDLRLLWRDPRLKAALFTGALSPLLLVLLWRGAWGRLPPGLLLVLAAFSGLGGLGGNAFALERRGLLLLFSFPVDRFLILVAKNVAAFAVRAPSLLGLLAVAAVSGATDLLLPLLAIGVVTMLLMAAGDNFMSILFPVPVPAPGGNPYRAASGGRGLVAAAMGGALMVLALVVAAPFAFLAGLPIWLERRGLFLVTLPLAVAGAASVYAMLTAGAARLLARREPDLLSRVLCEE
jgi:ABC-2 type transport system permease protein